MPKQTAFLFIPSSSLMGICSMSFLEIVQSIYPRFWQKWVLVAR
nr:hypothetical protein [Peptoanaerobacter stomatis]